MTSYIKPYFCDFVKMFLRFFPSFFVFFSRKTKKVKKIGEGKFFVSLFFHKNASVLKKIQKNLHKRVFYVIIE